MTLDSLKEEQGPLFSANPRQGWGKGKEVRIRFFLGRSEGIKHENLGYYGVSFWDRRPSDYSSSMYGDPIGRVQEAAETSGSLEEPTISELISVDHVDGSLCGSSSEYLLPSADDHEDAPPVRLHAQSRNEWIVDESIISSGWKRDRG
jgi:hypothetical protein